MRTAFKWGVIVSIIYIVIMLLWEFFENPVFLEGIVFVVSYPVVLLIAIFFLVTDKFFDFNLYGEISRLTIILWGVGFYFIFSFLLSLKFRKKI